MGIGTALAVVGGISAVAGIDASKRAGRIANRQWAEWQRLYGGVEQELADFYNSLTADVYEAQGLEAQQLEFQKARQNISAFLEQRGLGQSGVAVETEKDLELANATQRAKIRQEAPFRLAESKQAFLATGMGQKQQIQSDQLNSARNEASSWYQGATAAFTGLASGVASGDITSVFGMNVGSAATGATVGAGANAVGGSVGAGVNVVPIMELT